MPSNTVLGASDGAVVGRASIVFVALLLAGLAAAFAKTQSLKLQPPPFSETKVTKVFSPTCSCGTSAANIRFVLRARDLVTVTILDRNGHGIRTLVENRPHRAGKASFEWDGRSDDGFNVPDGAYWARVGLATIERVVTLPNRIIVDTRAPRIRLRFPTYHWISPDRDGRHDWLRLRYRVTEPAHGVLIVDGVRSAVTRSQMQSYHLDWFGTKGGQRLPPGKYQLTVRAEDLAGNLSKASAPLRIEVRFVDITRAIIHAAPSSRLRVRVRTDAHTLRWRLGSRHGTFSAPILMLRASRHPGRYELVVSAHRHRDRATVIVSADREGADDSHG